MLSLPNEYQSALPLFFEFIRRAIDGTVPPLFLDTANQRIIIGGTAASAAPATMEVATGNLKIVTGGNGIIIPNAGGSSYYLLTVAEVTNDDGSVQPVLTLTKQ